MSDLKGKVAIVTGAGQGVGEGIAHALSKLGAKLVVAGRTLSKVEATAADLEANGGEALAVECDVNDAASLEALVNQTVAHFGGIQILINNAQEVPLGSLMDVTDDSFTSGFTSGPLATFRLMKLCHPHLKGDGCIINLASTAAKRWDMSGYGAYAAVKEGIRSLTRAAACEWAKDGIRTNVIMPHATSPGLAWWIENNPEESAAFIASIPMQRVGECEEDIGRAVASFCTDSFAYMNGQSVALDGGQAHVA
jgi:meso-butanediol dehydrogenase / (S,S)-butanediol dehydrogenase / diacetyl reductase